jgi:glycosyltransferase involved in cell wall biosynthesis
VTEEIKVPQLSAGTEKQYNNRNSNVLASCLNEIQTSASWRLVKPIRLLERRFPAAIRVIALLVELLTSVLTGKLLQYWRQRKDIKAIYTSGLFDAGWYVQRYPEVAIAGFDPAVHYLTLGAKAGCWPNPTFDPITYIAKYIDKPTSVTNPLLHYVRHVSILQKKVDSTNAVSFLPLSLREIVFASGLFDADWYLATYPDVRVSNSDPLFHYLTNGWLKGYDPSERFNGQLYLECRPHVREDGLNPLLHYVINGDPADPSNEPFANCPSARMAVAALIERNCSLDPELCTNEILHDQNTLRCFDGHARGSLFVQWKRVFAKLDRPYNRIICVSGLGNNEINHVAIHAINAVIKRHSGEGILLLVTDFENEDLYDWLPQGASSLILAEHLPDLTIEDRASLVEILIRALKPKAVFNINSHACWVAIQRRGKSLSAFCDFYVASYFQDYNQYGQVSLFTQCCIRDCLQSIRKVYSDHARVQQELIEQFGIPVRLQQRFEVVRQPIKNGLKNRGFARADHEKPLRVFWAGPFNRQNNLALLPEIVRKGNRITLDVYSCGGDPDSELLSDFACSSYRIRLMGEYSSIEAIPTEDYGAFLFTAQWGGLPRVILDVAAMGVPIVTSDVGGIGELIDIDTGWLIPDYLNAQSYVDALELIRSDYEESQRRVANLLVRVATIHSWQTYLDSFSVPPSFVD